MQVAEFETLQITFRQMIPEAPPLPPTGNFLKISTKTSEKVRDKVNEDFHKIFKLSIPGEEEVLVAGVKGSLFQKVTTDGKFWISEYHLCFKANWPQSLKLCIDLSNVINIKKGNPYYLIKDAIEVETVDEKFLIGNFSNTHEFQNRLIRIWDDIVPPASFIRKFPDLRNISCVCPRPELSSCQVCKKVKEINAADASGTQRHPDCPSFKSKSAFYNLPEMASSTPELSVQMNTKGAGMLRVNTTGRNSSRVSMPALREDDELKDIKLIVPSTDNHFVSVTSKCTCSDDNELQLVHESVYPLSLSTIWNEWQCITSEGTVFLDFLYEIQKVTKLKLTPWVAEHVPSQDLRNAVPVEDIIESEFEPRLADIKPGYHRKTERLLPLNHGIPFIPKTAVGTDVVKVLHVLGENELCVYTIGTLNALGLDTIVRFCLKGNESSTVLKVYANAKATGKGKINPPKSTYSLVGLMEKGTIEGIKSYYSDMNKYFKKRLADIKPVAPKPCRCSSILGEKFNYLFNDALNSNIESLWNDMFTVTGNRGLAHYISKELHWKDLKFSEWKSATEISENDLKSMDSTGQDLSFQDAKESLSRYCSYGVAVKHKVAGSNSNSIVPRTAKFVGQQTITHISPFSVGINMKSQIKEIGTTAEVQICLQSTHRGVNVRVMAVIIFSQHGHSFPKELALKTMNDHLAAMYVTNLESARSSEKQRAPAKEARLTSRVAQPPQLSQPQLDTNFVLALGLCVVLIINAMTLMMVVKVLSLAQIGPIQL